MDNSNCITYLYVHIGVYIKEMTMTAIHSSWKGDRPDSTPNVYHELIFSSEENKITTIMIMVVKKMLYCLLVSSNLSINEFGICCLVQKFNQYTIHSLLGLYYITITTFALVFGIKY